MNNNTYNNLFAAIYWGIVLLVLFLGAALMISLMLGGCEINRPPMPKVTDPLLIKPTDPLYDHILMGPTIMISRQETPINDMETISNLPGEPNIAPSSIYGGMLGDQPTPTYHTSSYKDEDIYNLWVYLIIIPITSMLITFGICYLILSERFGRILYSLKMLKQDWKQRKPRNYWRGLVYTTLQVINGSWRVVNPFKWLYGSLSEMRLYGRKNGSIIKTIMTSVNTHQRIKRNNHIFLYISFNPTFRLLEKL